MKVLAVFFAFLALAQGFVLRPDDEELEWNAWKAFHGKTYATESEHAARKAIWHENLLVSMTL